MAWNKNDWIAFILIASIIIVSFVLALYALGVWDAIMGDLVGYMGDRSHVPPVPGR